MKKIFTQGNMTTPNANNSDNVLQGSPNSRQPTPLGASWNVYLSQNVQGDIYRRMYTTISNGRNANVNTVVTPLEMYKGLLYPSCTVGIDAKLRKKLRDYATRMLRGAPIYKTERDRMDVLLKRLVAAGDQCGFTRKDPGKKYRLPTKKEMEDLGLKAAGASGKFFYKRPRKTNPTTNPRSRSSVSPPARNPSPTKRMKVAVVTSKGVPGADSMTPTQLNYWYQVDPRVLHGLTEPTKNMKVAFVKSQGVLGVDSMNSTQLNSWYRFLTENPNPTNTTTNPRSRSSVSPPARNPSPTKNMKVASVSPPARNSSPTRNMKVAFLKSHGVENADSLSSSDLNSYYESYQFFNSAGLSG